MSGVFGIRNKASGEFLACGKKAGWTSARNAKLAFNQHMGTPYSEQEYFEVVNLSEAYNRLEGLEK